MRGTWSPRGKAAPHTEDLDWQLKGICRNHPEPELWTPDPPSVEDKSMEAKRLCHECPVMLQCRQWALARKEAWGVWGGLSEGDRHNIWVGRPVKTRTHRKTLRDLGVA